MLKYRGSRLVRAGFIGVVLIMMIVAVGLAPQQISEWASSVRYQARFADGSGLTVGNNVTVSGMKAGEVTAVSLDGKDALVSFTVDARLPLGSKTTAHIRTGTLLGQRILTLEPDGGDRIKPNAVIPVSRTFAPYSLTEAVSELTTNTAGTDTAGLNQALDTLSSTVDQIAPQLGPTFDGLTRISKALNERDAALGDLLEHGEDVTAILARRATQVSTLILNANDLVGVLSERRWAIVELLAHTSAVAREVSGLVADNQQKLAPTLQKLNSVVEVLERNRDNIAVALPRLAKYQMTLGEVVSNGPYYSANIPNLDLPQLLQPFMDYAFGFRRGTNAGQPPDNTGPRAEIPFPYNGIPQGPR